jgi:hypothetical protein
VDLGQKASAAIGFIKALILEKALIFLKKSLKIIEIFIKASHFSTEASISLEISSKRLGYPYKIFILI